MPPTGQKTVDDKLFGDFGRFGFSHPSSAARDTIDFISSNLKETKKKQDNLLDFRG